MIYQEAAFKETTRKLAGQFLIRGLDVFAAICKPKRQTLRA